MTCKICSRPLFSDEGDHCAICRIALACSCRALCRTWLAKHGWPKPANAPKACAFCGEPYDVDAARADPQNMVPEIFCSWACARDDEDDHWVPDAQEKTP